MNTLIRKSWEGLLSPMLRRPSALQLAALCWRRGKKGIEVLLVTSSQGRWILPKGWPIDGLDDSKQLSEARREALFPLIQAQALAWHIEFVSAEEIDRLNIGPVSTMKISWDQPHEGNMYEFLWKRRSIERAW